MRLLHDFHERLVARFPVDGAAMPMSEWLCRNTTLKNQPFRFDGYEFQIAIANDMHPDMAVEKPSQVGLTEVQVRKALAFAVRERGSTGIYTLPNEKMYRRVSKTRIRPLIQADRAFHGGGDEAPSLSMDLYELGGQSFVYVTGMTEGDATSIPADVLWHDELDLSSQQIISLYQSRVQNSRFKITQRFSTPTHVGYGINAAIKISDRHEYMCRCRACNHWQIPDFTPAFVTLPGYDGPDELWKMSIEDAQLIHLDGVHVKCERCGRPLDLSDPTLREWVPMHPGRLTRGYKVRPFSTDRLPPDYLIRQLVRHLTADDLKGFMNTALGEAYTDSNSRLSEESIKAVMKGVAQPTVGASTPVYVGIDVGQTCHVILGTPNGFMEIDPFLFALVPVEELEQFVKTVCDNYFVVGGAIDRHPYEPTANAIFEASGKRIVPVEYRGQANLKLVLDEMQNLSHAQCNRTRGIDRVVRAIRRGRTSFQGYGQYQNDVVAHLQDMVRIEVPEEEARWEKLSGVDHFFHSLVFLFLAPLLTELIRAKANLDLRELFLVSATEPPKEHLLGVRTRLQSRGIM
jgi:hypothetical protein